MKWLSGKGYPVAADVVYFLGDIDSAYRAFESLLEEYLGYYTYSEKAGRFGSIFDGVSDEWKKVSDSSVASLVKKDFTDRFSLDTEKQAYTWSPSILTSVGVAGVDMALGAGASGTGGSGDPDSPGSGSGTDPGGSGSGSGGITIIGGPEWDIIGDISGSVQTGIADGVSNTGSFLSGVLSSVKDILLDLGGVPALLAEFFSFLPSEVITAIGIGLSLWLLPALLGLARSGLRALGSICSSLFGFISSFFS